MVQLMQVLILLTAPSIASWDMANSFRQHPKTSATIPPTELTVIGTQESARFKSHSLAQQRRIEQMGVNGVIYFDAPPTTSRRRILR
jgi:hypothetical protein